MALVPPATGPATPSIPPPGPDRDPARHDDGKTLLAFLALAGAAVAVFALVAWTGLTDAVRWDSGGAKIAPPPSYQGPPSYAFTLRWTHLVVAAWAGLALAAVPRGRVSLAAAALALAVRLLASPDTILMGVDYAYMRLADGTGLQYTGKLYGPTWTSWMGSVWWLSGAWPGHVGWTNLVLSVATAGLGAAIADAVGGRRAGWVGAVLLATLPLPVALARTETEFVLAALLQATGWWGLLAPGRRGAWLTAASAVLLAHLRPDLMAPAAVLAGALAAQGRWIPGAAALGVGVVGRVIAIATGFSAGSLASPAGVKAEGVPFSPDRWLGIGGTFAELDPTVTPLLLAPFVVLALTRGRRRLGLPALLLLAGTAPYLHLPRPTDVLRFSLPAQLDWAVLAAVGLAGLPAWATAAGLLAALASAWPARAPLLQPPFPWQVEHVLVQQVLAETPRTTTVWYRAPWDRTGAFRAWLEVQGAGNWKELGDGDVPGDGDVVLQGRAMAGGLPAGCAGVPAEVVVRAQDVEPGVGEYVIVSAAQCRGAGRPPGGAE